MCEPLDGSGPRLCHYEVLGVERDVDGDQLKKKYRQLALKWHPDKNMHDPDLAKRTFQQIQQAYEVLSDPQERAWYDAHREAILKHGGLHGDNSDVDVDGIDLFPYFSSACYKGFDESREDNFYAVYRQLFAELNKEDQQYAPAGETLHYPGFGQADSDDDVFREFYAFFSAYCTPRSYAWRDTYDTRQAENRRVSRLMEKENKKERDQAKKERNELVRNLVKFVRKRDKRWAAYNERLEAKVAENAQRTEELRQKHLAERARMLEEATATRADFGMGEEMKDALDNLENEYDSEQEQEDNFCVACNKQLRNEKAYRSHLKQKKHLDTVAELKELMTAEELTEVGVASEHFGSGSESGPEESAEGAENSEEACEVNDQADEMPEEQVSEEQKIGNDRLSKKAKAKAKKKAKATANNASSSSSVPDMDTTRSCVTCGELFPSKNKLFTHLKTSGHSQFIPGCAADKNETKGKSRRKK